ncbi:hypothetical protein [Thalassoporum mexicanum]|nr:hypothetical protein [Pseudanabaena sp. PCC 7367]
MKKPNKAPDAGKVLTAIAIIWAIIGNSSWLYGLASTKPNPTFSDIF